MRYKSLMQDEEEEKYNAKKRHVVVEDPEIAGERKRSELEWIADQMLKPFHRLLVSYRQDSNKQLTRESWKREPPIGPEQSQWKVPVDVCSVIH